jgi:hypothetical protein
LLLAYCSVLPFLYDTISDYLYLLELI